MGQWGYNPEDGDGAHDLLAELEDVVWKDLRIRAARINRVKKKGRYWTEERLTWVGAVRHIMRQWRGHPPITITRTARRYCRFILEDEEYMKSWRRPFTARKHLEAAEAEFIAMDERYKEVREEQKWEKVSKRRRRTRKLRPIKKRTPRTAPKKK